jgi:hypothetical protein
MRTVIFYLVALSMVSCHESQRASIDNDPFKQLLICAFDSLKNAYDFDSKFLVHSEFYPDNLKKESINRLSTFLSKDSLILAKNELQLLQELMLIANDSVMPGFNEIDIDGIKLLFYEADSLFRHHEYFGTFSMTNLVIDDSANRCSFYLAINCGNNCSRGFIFFGKRKASQWELESVYQVWG